MEKESDIKMEENKDNTPQEDNKEEKTETTPLVIEENAPEDQDAQEPVNIVETWGQWFASKLSLPPGSFRDTLTDPNLTDKVKDGVKDSYQKVAEGVNKTYTKIDELSISLKAKFAEKFPETSAGLKSFSDQLSNGVVVGYENTAEGYHKFRENASIAWSTNYDNTAEALKTWQENVKAGLITGYDNTKEGFESFKVNTKKYWDVALDKTKETYESFKTKVTGGDIQGFDPTEEGYQQYMATGQV